MQRTLVRRYTITNSRMLIRAQSGPEMTIIDSLRGMRHNAEEVAPQTSRRRRSNS